MSLPSLAPSFLTYNIKKQTRQLITELPLHILFCDRSFLFSGSFLYYPIFVLWVLKVLESLDEYELSVLFYIFQIISVLCGVGFSVYLSLTLLCCRLSSGDHRFLDVVCL